MVYRVTSVPFLDQEATNSANYLSTYNVIFVAIYPVAVPPAEAPFSADQLKLPTELVVPVPAPAAALPLTSYANGVAGVAPTMAKGVTANGGGSAGDHPPLTFFMHDILGGGSRPSRTLVSGLKSSYSDMAPSCIPVMLMATTLLLIPLMAVSSHAPSNDTDLAALLAFRSQLSDPLSVLNNNWTADVSFCSWIGVTCSHRHHGRVTALQLPDISLQGELSPHLGNLSFLHVLNLTNTALTGSMPADLGRLRRLRYLNLGHNSLSDTIPSTVGNLTMLQFLVLNFNQLYGEIPYELRNMRSLRHLSLEENYISGLIPNFTFDSMPSLSHIYVQNNSLSGPVPSGIGSLLMLQVLHLKYNQLSGPVPPTIFNMSRMVVLSLAINKNLTGHIPSNTSFSLPMLQIISLYDNKFEGPIPLGLAACQHLQQLSLGRNLLVDVVPVWLAKLPQLTMISIGGNKIVGPIPAALSNLSMLNELDISYANLSQEVPGLVPESFGRLTNLVTLDLSSNNLSGTIPNYLANFTYLAYLNLSFNRLEGHVPNGGVFSNITSQSLAGNVGLCGAPRLGLSSCIDKSQQTYGRHILKFILPAVIIGAGAFAASLYTMIKRKNKKQPYDTASTGITDMISHRLVSYHEIARATENFSEDNLLGAGSFGKVFKGQLDDGSVVAIKVLSMQVERAVRSFEVECQVLRMARHRNLIHILNTCSNLDFRALLLQYMPNELAFMGRASRNSDVFSFGIMLLEVFTGKRPTYPTFVGESSLRHCILQAFPAKLIDILDERLYEDEQMNQAFHHQTITTSPYSSSIAHNGNFLVSTFKMGLECSSDSPDKRPSMGDVVTSLKNIKKDYSAFLLKRSFSLGSAAWPAMPVHPDPMYTAACSTCPAPRYRPAATACAAHCSAGTAPA
ncbi:hypothetical protein QYE76_000662 [Lolium multiflorum]|uniref:Protein kinase domain-containing protein n=1 Tax=Lolium multiflorum TaxID=4521 RepID=A0AAD8RKK7_LOLMU|nr:hypothetical protein QYE76_000662 [Lolium multiflorum]